MDLSSPSWRFLPEQRYPGPRQMAFDEIAAETAAAGGPATVRVYRWDPATVSLGYTQSADILDHDYCTSYGIDVTRRQTGGGTIYHDDFGDIAYSIAVPADAVSGDLTESYHTLCTPLFAAFERMGVDARFVEQEREPVFEPACYLRGLHPAHDVVGPDGRKLAGNAQYRQREAVVQHGSLTFERATDAHCSVFDAEVSAEDFEARVGSIREYADISRADAVDALETALREWVGVGEPGEWTDAEVTAARERVREKFASDQWVEERTDPT